MKTTLFIFALFIIISTLYFLKDTITEALSGGKSFMPNEMKNSNTPPTIALLKSYSNKRKQPNL